MWHGIVCSVIIRMLTIDVDMQLEKSMGVYANGLQCI